MMLENPTLWEVDDGDDLHYDFGVTDTSQHLLNQGRQPHGILIIDNYHIHGLSLISPDQNQVIIFLCPNITPILQPCDQHLMFFTNLRYKVYMINMINTQCLDEDIPLKEVVNGIEHTDFAAGVCRSWSMVTRHEMKAAWRPVLYDHWRYI